MNQIAGDAVAFPLCGAQPKQRIDSEQSLAGVRVGREKSEHDHEGQQSTEIAHAPTKAREPPEAFLRYQRRHHRIVEYGRKLDADRSKRKCGKRDHDRVGLARPAFP
jgi:hypothetical protein